MEACEEDRPRTAPLASAICLLLRMLFSQIRLIRLIATSQIVAMEESSAILPTILSALYETSMQDKFQTSSLHTVPSSLQATNLFAFLHPLFKTRDFVTASSVDRNRGRPIFGRGRGRPCAMSFSRGRTSSRRSEVGACQWKE